MLKFIKPSLLILIKKNNCTKCHKINKNLEIPSFKKISYRYVKTIFYKKYLFKRIKLGSKGIWGNLIMPKNNIRNFLIKFIINWILDIKKKTQI